MSIRQKVGPSVRKQLRQRYEAQWGKAYSEDENFLSELWIEAKETVSPNKRPGGRALKAVYLFTLSLMKENSS